MHIGAPILHISGTARLRVYPGHPDNVGDQHIGVYNDAGALILTFVGTGDALHGFFLGLHEVLIDAGRAGGFAELIIPGRALVDEVLAEAEGDGEGEGGQTSGQA